MTFSELLQELHNTEPQPNPNYWKLIKENALTILHETGVREGKDVAKDLCMSASRFSTITPLLKAIVRNNA